MEVDDVVRRLGPWYLPGAGTLGVQLANALRHAIDTGLLPPGTRLPPERTLAAALAVSRPTIQHAMADLRAAGVVEARQGSGTWITATAGTALAGGSLAEAALVGRGINLAASVPMDPGALGDSRLQLLGTIPGHGYAPDGLPALRVAIAAHLGRSGIAADPDDVVVTDGGHGALVDALGALVGRGDPVLVERYTYPGLLDIVSELGGVAVAVAGDHDGPRPDALDALVRRVGPVAAVVMPGLGNPTGRGWSAERRVACAAILDRHQVPVIVDDVVAPLRADGGDAVPPALGCVDAPVVTVSSLSKVVWGGLRVGWVHGDRDLLARIVGRRRRLHLGSSIPAQQLAVPIVERFESWVAAKIVSLRDRRAHLCAALARELPHWEVADDQGGPSLWVRLPIADAASFVPVARASGVDVLAGGQARADGEADPHLRLAVDRPAPQLDDGVRRLAHADRLLR